MPEQKIDEETARRIQELQFLEQNLQNLLLQKQVFQVEANDTDNALSEIKETKDDVYKIVGQVMLKAKKENLSKELKRKKEVLQLRIKAIEKQEQFFREKLEKTRSIVMSKLK